MKIFVKAKAGARENKVEPPKVGLFDAVEKVDEKMGECYVVSVTAEPKKGRANDAIVRLIAKYFNISPSQIRLLHGATAKRKVFEIPDIINF